MSSIVPRFEISESEIARVVHRFYEQVRAHEILAPVFAKHVSDWPEHEDRIIRFWRNAILRHKVYHGNPVIVHARAGNVRPGMFEPWLKLFDATLQAELKPGQAQAWSSLAHRIGRSLRAGVSDVTRPGEIPNLKV